MEIRIHELGIPFWTNQFFQLAGPKSWLWLALVVVGLGVKIHTTILEKMHIHLSAVLMFTKGTGFWPPDVFLNVPSYFGWSKLRHSYRIFQRRIDFSGRPWFSTHDQTLSGCFFHLLCRAHPSVIKHGHGISSPRRLVIPAASPAERPGKRSISAPCGGFSPSWMRTRTEVWRVDAICRHMMITNYTYIYIPHIIWTVYIYIHICVYRHCM